MTPATTEPVRGVAALDFFHGGAPSQWRFGLGGMRLDDDADHDEAKQLIRFLQAAASFLFMGVTAYRLYERRGRATTPGPHPRPSSRLSAPAAVFLVCQGVIIASLLHILYFTVTFMSDRSSSSLGSVTQLVALVAATVASLTSVLLILLASAKSFRMAFNAAMFILSSLSLGVLGPWTNLTLGSAMAYGVSVLADGCLKDSDSDDGPGGVSLFGAWSFTYIHTYLAAARRKSPSPADLPRLSSAFSPHAVQSLVDHDRKDGSTALPGFLRLIYVVCRTEMAVMFLCEVVNMACKFAEPWVLQAFLVRKSFSLVCLMVLLGLVHAATQSQAIYRRRAAGAKIKAGLGACVFERALGGQAGRREADMSAVNLIEIDVMRIQEFLMHIQVFFFTPLQVVFALVSLGMILGWQSGIAAAGSVVFMIPLYYLCGLIMHRFQIRAMQRKDARMSLTAEALANMFMIKLWGQEPLLEKKLDRLRHLELAVQQGLTWVKAIMSALSRSASTITSVAAFMVALAVGGNLSSEQIFPALQFCALLVFPLALVPLTLSSMASCIVSYGRLKAFCAEESGAEEPLITLEENSIRGGVVLDSVALPWTGVSPTSFWHHISLSVQAGELATLYGPSSGGKTTILKMLIGALRPAKGSVSVGGTVAYMSQEPWLCTGSIRDNILFGRELDEPFYQKVVNACALNVDLEAMPAGDATLVGSHSSGLSGGQKSRISLARAIYSRADVYVLDDPLAALDVRVHAFVVENVLGPRGVLKDHTRVIVTNSSALMFLADRTFEVSDGTAVETAFSNCTFSDAPTTSDESSDEATLDASSKPATRDRPSDATDLDELDFPIKHTATLIAETTDEGVLLDTASSRLTNITGRAAGLIPFAVYNRWLRIAGWSRWAVMAGLSIVSYLTSIYARYLLKGVAETLNRGAAVYGLQMYAAASAIQTAVLCASMLVGWYLCLKPTAQRIHGSLVAGVLRSSMQFLYTVPSGEILNRFANDLARNDEPLIFTMFGVLNTVLMVGSALAVFIVTVPASVLAIVPLLGLCWWLLQRVLGVLVDTKRLETGSRGPLITNLQDTMDGADVIRVFRRHEHFREANYTNLTRNIEAFMAFVIVDVWLVLRLSLVSITLQGLAGTAFVVTNASSSTTGLVMSYMLQISMSLSGMVLLRTQMEAEMVSVQRIFAVADIPPEPRTLTNPPAPIPAAWPTAGHITFRNFSAAYTPAHPPVLRNISLSLPAGRATAVVGRTGAGKSSLAMALLRILEPVGGGGVEIDGRDVAAVDVAVLRARVAIIPQNCRAFAGTVRENLDPEGACEEGELRRVVRESMLAGYFGGEKETLDHPVERGGSNLSSGQLQLLAIARCLLLDTNVVVLDEVTAAIDHAAERVIQQVLTTHFEKKTRIVISHRLENAIENDHIVVLDKGEVVESGAPRELFAAGGIFRDMIVASGLQDRMS